MHNKADVNAGVDAGFRKSPFYKMNSDISDAAIKASMRTRRRAAASAMGIFLFLRGKRVAASPDV
ncbi:hypothetical protein [Rhizobium leguminosarum]|uniref:hypothetical protein n=1 Tax=Rhizobium leguminosarum TaxID=384 RepID=UPI0012DB4758|nr:hypothetical protein [Rhizobium leguminosarum]